MCNRTLVLCVVLNLKYVFKVVIALTKPKCIGKTYSKGKLLDGVLNMFVKLTLLKSVHKNTLCKGNQTNLDDGLSLLLDIIILS